MDTINNIYSQIKAWLAGNSTAQMAVAVLLLLPLLIVYLFKIKLWKPKRVVTRYRTRYRTYRSRRGNRRRYR